MNKQQLIITLVLVLLLWISNINTQYNIPGGLAMEGYNQYTLTDEQRKNIADQLLEKKNEYRENEFATDAAGDQTAQFAGIMSKMGVAQQNLEGAVDVNSVDGDEEGIFARIQAQGMLNQPQGEKIESQITDVIDPRSLADYQPQQQQEPDLASVITAAIDPKTLIQEQQLQQDEQFDHDQTPNYVEIERLKFQKQQELESQQEQITPAANNGGGYAVVVQAIDPQSFLPQGIQQPLQQQDDNKAGYDQTEYFSNLMKQKAVEQTILANEQGITSGPGIFQAVDPQTQAAPAPSSTKSWSSLNVRGYYIPQGRNSRRIESEPAENDQTSDYMRIMAQQRAYQEQIQSQQ